jgi:23S rRNA (adenine2503-C2)-methyltransferase
MDKTDIKSMTYEDIQSFFESFGEKKFRADQVFQWLHQKLVTSYDAMTNLSKSLQQTLKEETKITSLEIVDQLVSKIDGTEKYLFKLEDGHVIESVLMRYKHGNSVCISSQVGCRMGCYFCASTIGGLVRHLSASEMLEQIYAIQRHTGERVSNVVVMGTGEPLDNYDALLKFIHIIKDEKGLNISGRNITVSTCGLIDEIKALADENLSITLAISLHAPNDSIRKSMMPIAIKSTIDDLLNVCKYYTQKTHRRITFEYSLIAGVNDSPLQAKELSQRLKGLLCHVNLIPINPIEERDYKQGSTEAIDKFKTVLTQRGITATVRRELGRDIQAACGQLRKSYLESQE